MDCLGYAWYNPCRQQVMGVDGQSHSLLPNNIFSASVLFQDPPKTNRLNDCHLVAIHGHYHDVGEPVFGFGQYVEPEMEHLPVGDMSDERRSRVGQQVGPDCSKRTMILYRAVDAITSTFKPMDYVLADYGVGITSKVVDKVLDVFPESRSLLPRQGKFIHWALEHAQSMAVSYGRPMHVIMSTVPCSQVYEASNPGERFFDGPITAGRVLMTVTPEGEITATHRQSKDKALTVSPRS